MGGAVPCAACKRPNTRINASVVCAAQLLDWHHQLPSRSSMPSTPARKSRLPYRARRRASPNARPHQAARQLDGPGSQHQRRGFVANHCLHIGHHHALHGRVVVHKGLRQLIDRLRMVGLQSRQHRLLVGVERAPMQRQHVLVRVDHLAINLFCASLTHGTIVRAAPRDDHIGLALHTDDILACGKRCPAFGRTVLRSIGGPAAACR
jgi:hypothetical protein